MRTNIKNTKSLKNENENLLKQQKFRDEFIAQMAHEIKNNLSVMTSLSGVLLTEKLGSLNQNQKERIQHIYSIAMQVNNLVKDVVSYQRLGLGKNQLDKQQYKIEELCKDVMIEIDPFSTLKKVTVDVNIDAVTIFCDYNRILEVLLNLLLNAIKFSNPNTKVSLNVSSDGQNILFEVIDHGIGINDSEQEKIFDIFYQVKKTQADIFGSGLGLAICKTIVESHGGTIWFKSKIGKGSTFSFTIPQRKQFITKN